MSIKVVRNASQLERMTLVKPKIEIKATLRNASSTVFEQGYEETYISKLAMSVFIKVFLKRHFERKQKTQPSTQLGGT